MHFESLFLFVVVVVVILLLLLFLCFKMFLTKGIKLWSIGPGNFTHIVTVSYT